MPRSRRPSATVCATTSLSSTISTRTCPWCLIRDNAPVTRTGSAAQGRARLLGPCYRPVRTVVRMRYLPLSQPSASPWPLASRRSLLRGGALLGLSAATRVACASQPSRASASQAVRRTGAPPRGGHLVLDYKPSQVTGWSLPYSPTLGGHTASSDFSWNGKPYRVSLLP